MENKLISLNNKWKLPQDIHRPFLSSRAMLDLDNTGKLPEGPKWNEQIFNSVFAKPAAVFRHYTLKR